MSSIDQRALSATLEHLQALDFAHDLETALQEVVHSVAGSFSVTGAGLMFIDPLNVLRTVVASDEPGKVLESAQEQLGIGPCTDSLIHGALVVSEDVAEDDRWPGLADLVVPHGVRAVLGVPIKLGGGPVGSLNVYCDEPHRWDDAEQQAIRRYAGLIENVMGAAVLAHQRGRLVDQLQFALEHRVIIERAIGYVMGSKRLDAVHAFDHLRTMARSQRRKVAEIAAEILEGVGENPLGG